MATEWLGNKLVSDITPSDFSELLAEGATEDQWLDFKRDAYEPVKRHEMLKDITALANAEGGYLLIGAEEENGTLLGFHTVLNAQQKAEAMLRSCIQNISPRIEDLQIAAVCGPEDKALILARVPPSARGPHMYTLHNRTQFSRRYGTENREMTIDEIRTAFLQDRQLLQTRSLSDKLDALLAGAVRERRAKIDVTDHALEMLDPGDLRNLMEKRFREQIGDEPYYRLWAMPAVIDPQLIDTKSRSVLELVHNPPRTRRDGWVIWSMSDVRPTAEGLQAETGGGTQRLLLLRNGYVEFSHPARNDLFQWNQAAQEAAAHPWLYSYAVCEFPVNFCRFVSTVLDLLQSNGRVILGHSYFNIRGFRLYGDEPQSVRFGWPVSDPYDGCDMIGRAVEKDVPFDSDQAAFELIKQVYNSFGRSDGDIPFFNDAGGFDPDAGPRYPRD